MFNERELDLISRIPPTEANLQAIRDLTAAAQQAGDLKDFWVSWYGVERFEDLPQEGLERYKSELRALGWKDPETSNE